MDFGFEGMMEPMNLCRFRLDEIGSSGKCAEAIERQPGSSYTSSDLRQEAGASRNPAAIQISGSETQEKVRKIFH